MLTLLGCRAPSEQKTEPQGRPQDPPALPSAPGRARPNREAPRAAPDDVAAFLKTARLRDAAPELRDPEKGVLSVKLEDPSSSQDKSALISPALIEAPNAYKKTLAYYGLARALGIQGVPVSVKRALGVGEVAALLQKASENGVSRLLDRLSVQNDGRVELLFTTPGPEADPWRSPTGALLGMAGGTGTEALQKWAISEAPVPSEQVPALRSHIEMLALDFLAANFLRKTAFKESVSGRLLLLDNEDAFPETADPRALDPLLSALAACTRFPRALWINLKRLDAERIHALFLDGPFENWLISPRNAVLLGERRASLLSLIEAKIEIAGEAALLCL